MQQGGRSLVAAKLDSSLPSLLLESLACLLCSYWLGYYVISDLLLCGSFRRDMNNVWSPQLVDKEKVPPQVCLGKSMVESLVAAIPGDAVLVSYQSWSGGALVIKLLEIHPYSCKHS